MLPSIFPSALNIYHGALVAVCCARSDLSLNHVAKIREGVFRVLAERLGLLWGIDVS